MMVNQQPNGWPKLVAFAIVIVIGLSVMATLSAADLPGQMADYHTQGVQDTGLAGQINHDLGVMATLQPYEVEATRQAIVRESERADALLEDEQKARDQQRDHLGDVQAVEVEKERLWTQTSTYLTRVAGVVVMSVVGVTVTFVTCAYALARIRLAVPAKAEQPTALPSMPPAPPSRPMAPAQPDAPSNPPRLKPRREQPASLPEINLGVGDLTYSPNGHGTNGHGLNGGYSRNGSDR